MATYNQNSPWNTTQFVQGKYLGQLNIRPIPSGADDILYTIEPQYNHRPDLLAYDLYDDQKLWWVFAQRNMDVIVDPIYDFEAGVSIYLPQGDALRNQLGI